MRAANCAHVCTSRERARAGCSTFLGHAHASVLYNLECCLDALGRHARPEEEAEDLWCSAGPSRGKCVRLNCCSLMARFRLFVFVFASCECATVCACVCVYMCLCARGVACVHIIYIRSLVSRTYQFDLNWTPSLDRWMCVCKRWTRALWRYDATSSKMCTTSPPYWDNKE